MKRSLRIVFYIFLAGLFGLFSDMPSLSDEYQPADIRPSILKGTWYPENRNALSTSIRQYLSAAGQACPEGTIVSLIVPHAGHIYSGAVAAHAYRCLEKSVFKRVIMVGPSHRGFRGISVNIQTAYETPLGRVPVDVELAKEILKSGTDIRWIKNAHAVEHSLEIQLPFLQTVLKDFAIVPILMGQQDYDTCKNLARTLVKVLDSQRDTILLASSDLSHFHSHEKANALDQVFMAHVMGLDPRSLASDIREGKCEACGAGPVITVLMAAGAMGADRAVILNQANSGDVTGDRSRVVGYFSAALVRASDKDPHPP